MKVRIVQLLCPQRHCVLAAAYESETGLEDPAIAVDVKESFDELVAQGQLNRHCDICRSRTLRTEDNASRFRTMAEARPFLEENERQQAATRKFYRASRG